MSSGSQRTIHGIDFSGAEDAGEKIWISTGEIEDGKLRIKSCRPIAEEWKVSDRRSALDQLYNFISKSDHSVFGLDFSFGLPEILTDTDDWKGFIQSFEHPNVETMQVRYSEKARKQTNGERAHLKRTTDKATDARSPYGFITRSQIYYGISEVLKPLVSEAAVSVLPMQPAEIGRPWLLEVYPAGTLYDLELNRDGYKARTVKARSRRAKNVDGLDERIEIDEDARQCALCNDDALDSLAAAFATFRAVREGPLSMEDLSAPEGFDGDDEAYRKRVALEGHIYV